MPSVCSVSLMFLTVGMSRLAIRQSRSVRSSVARVVEWKCAGVSTTITSYACFATSRRCATRSSATSSASSGRTGAGNHVHARGVHVDRAGELVRVEVARRHDEVVDRLGRIEAHHDRAVAELQIEVDEQRAAAVPAGEDRRETTGRHRAADPALGREDGDDLALGAAAHVRRARPIVRVPRS